MFTVIIPAYNPDQKLVCMIDELYKNNLKDIIVVDDGSMGDARQIFSSFQGLVTLITHDCNRGKGAAIKTALEYILNREESSDGFIIMDADGQHRVCDAKRLLSFLRVEKNGLILGTRHFDRAVPVRSLIGNTITRYVFRLCSGKWVKDTQTGLRAFSYNLVERLMDIQGDRYEYEMNVLLTCAKENIPIIEVPIPAIYHDKDNSCSHFRALRDSARIYANLLKFSGASFVSFLCDYILFFPFVKLFGLVLGTGAALICGNIASRFISASLNYYLNSTYVFQQKKSRKTSLLSYVVLAAMILYLNSLVLYFLHDYIGMNEALAKLFTEMILFALSFCVQHFVIFENKLRKEGSRA